MTLCTMLATTPLAADIQEDSRNENGKGNDGPGLDLDLVHQRLILRGDLVVAVSVGVIAVVGAVVLDIVAGVRDHSKRRDKKQNAAPSEPREEVDGDDGAGVDASVTGAFPDADGLCHVPGKGDDDLRVLVKGVAKPRDVVDSRLGPRQPA